MKHLKQFNEHIRIDDSNLYEPITMSQFYSRKEHIGKDEDFTEKEKSQILKINKPDHHDIQVFSGPKSLEINITNYDKGIGNKRFTEIIYKSPDEWFFVMETFYTWHEGKNSSYWRESFYKRFPEQEELVNNSFFKCDSLEGLIKFIQDRYEYIYHV